MSANLTSIKLLWKFVRMVPQSKELELEWQKIQQDEHNEDFRYQVYKGRPDGELAYKRGFTDGINWCLKRFS